MFPSTPSCGFWEGWGVRKALEWRAFRAGRLVVKDAHAG
jgi:hypothetical protein